MLRAHPCNAPGCHKSFARAIELGNHARGCAFVLKQRNSTRQQPRVPAFPSDVYPATMLGGAGIGHSIGREDDSALEDGGNNDCSAGDSGKGAPTAQSGRPFIRTCPSARTDHGV
jgi:hypothetical protein